jgi:hypothetical protein
MWVIYGTDFGLDDCIYCTLYIHNSGLRATQRDRCSTYFAAHRYTLTVILSVR